MELFNKIMSGTSDIIWAYILIAGFIGLGIYFSIRTKFVQFRYIK